MPFRPILALILLASAAFGQTANTVVGSSYSLPAPINAAPGQILNLTVAGVGASLTQRVAAQRLPLPDMLAGITVQLRQVFAPQSVAVPILAVRPVSTCPSGIPLGTAPCGQYAVVTVQMPYELVLPCQSPSLVCPLVVTAPPQLIISENGTPGGAVELNPLSDQIHVATSCDLDSAAMYQCSPAPLVTHADGSLVTQSSPALVGEEVAIYALGLGITNPAAQTGAATPTPAPVTTTLAGVLYNYGVNLPPIKGIPAPFAICALGTTCPIPPAYAGLTPSTVGLYQVNVVVPPPQSAFPCGAGVTSNLTISLVGATSYDGAGICVSVPLVP